MPENYLSVDDVLDDGATFEPAALAAVRALARSKPWQGTEAEQLAKFNGCLTALCEAYGLPQWTLKLQVGGRAKMNRRTHTVTLTRLSVVTLLHLVGILRQQSEVSRFRWSINLFRRCFPRSFAACERIGPFLVRRDGSAGDCIGAEPTAE